MKFLLGLFLVLFAFNVEAAGVSSTSNLNSETSVALNVGKKNPRKSKKMNKKRKKACAKWAKRSFAG